jgi:hypothetical protein
VNRTIANLAAAAVGLSVAVLGGCGKGDEKFRAQLDPVVARITQKASDAAALTGGASAETLERTTALLTDLAGLGADLKSLYVDGEKQQGFVNAGQAYLRPRSASSPRNRSSRAPMRGWRPRGSRYATRSMPRCGPASSRWTSGRSRTIAS